MLKILAVIQNMPHVRSYTTILFENLLPLLKNKMDVHLTWFVPRTEEAAVSPPQESDSSILYLADYKNAVEVIQQVMPDIIYCHPGYSPVEYAFAMASRAFKIPLIAGEFGNPLLEHSNRIIVLKSFLDQFFQGSIPGEVSKNQKQFMKRTRYFLCKYFFMIRTLQALKISKIKMLTSIFSDIKRYILGFSYKANLRFSCDINFVESEKTVERLVKQGFNKSSLIVVGNPTYDTLFQRVENLEPVPRPDNKIRILLVTTNPHDPVGHRTKKLHDSWLRVVATEFVKYKNEISLVIKIHPSGEILSDYESIIKPIEPSISIHQHGDIVKFIKESDVVIGTSTSTALVCSLIANKPIIIWNAYGVKGDAFLERNLALECKDESSLIPLIKQSLTSNSASPSKINEFICEYLYKSDGRATERICEVILELLKNRYLDYTRGDLSG